MTMVIDETAGYTEMFCIECTDMTGVAKTFEHTVEQKPQVDCTSGGRIAKSTGIPVSSTILNIAYEASSTAAAKQVAKQDYYGGTDQFLTIDSSAFTTAERAMCELGGVPLLLQSDCSSLYSLPGSTPTYT